MVWNCWIKSSKMISILISKSIKPSDDKILNITNCYEMTYVK